MNLDDIYVTISSWCPPSHTKTSWQAHARYRSIGASSRAKDSKRMTLPELTSLADEAKGKLIEKYANLVAE